MPRGWLFEKMGPMGGAHHGAFLGPLNASVLPQEYLLAREAIQNSVDAKSDAADVVKMRFVQRTLDRTTLDRLVSDVRLLSDDGPVDRYHANDEFRRGLSNGNFLEAAIDSDITSQNVVFIEDYGTVGLGGPLRGFENPDARYYNLVLGFGIEDTSDSHRGGSYGFGKSVYPRASNASTTAFYSVFEPSEETEGAHARLIIASIFHSHEFNDEVFNGRAWFGLPEYDSQKCAPLIDNEAHELASRLGFTQRGPSETGTSIMALGSSIDMDVLRIAIEDNWWPRIVDRGLSCELESDYELLPPPEPRHRSDLHPFIRSYSIANRSNANEQEDELYYPFRRAQRLQLGGCGFVAGDPADFSTHGRNVDGIAEYQPRNNAVALMRSPRMVVKYLDARAGTDIVGAYVASEEFDPILRLSEPATHERWSASSSRLEGHAHRTTVNGLENRVQRGVTTYRERFADAGAEITEKPRALQQTLGRLLRTPGAGRRTTTPQRGPFNVNIEQRREEVGQAIAVKGTAEISLRRAAEVNNARCRTSISAWVVVDDNMRREDRLEVTINRVNHPDRRINESRDVAEFDVSRDRSVRCDFETEELPEYCLVEIAVESEQLGDNEQAVA